MLAPNVSVRPRRGGRALHPAVVFKMDELAMTPCLIGFLVLVGILALAWMGGKLVESRAAQWEEDQVRRIAADDQDEKRCPDRLMGIYTGAMPRGAELSRSAPCDSVDGVAPGPHHQSADADLPDSWRELDGKGSFDDAWAEMRRKTGGA
jgi:hypothetical protein